MSKIAHPFLDILGTVHAQLRDMTSGDVATYIPELAKADPDLLAISIATVDGEVYSVGDSDAEYTIQSISKPFAYAAGLDRYGRDEMLKRVGVEPTGDAFNAIVLDETNRRPFNPMVNAGAIAVSALFPGSTAEQRAAAMLQSLSRFAGRRLSIDESVFNSESETGHRNRAIAYLLLNAGMLAADPLVTLDTYFRQCSILVKTRDLAAMAATLANGGVNPRTSERALQEEHIPDVLTVMLTCGMYDYAGQWAYEAGLPAKSGVAGGVLAVVPGQFGIAAYSPRLDRFGNSVRAVEACRLLSRFFSLHSFRHRNTGDGIKGREWTGSQLRSRRWRAPADRARLDAEGKRILILEARGELSIGKTERLLRSAAAAVHDRRWVILDIGTVSGIDGGAARLLRDFAVALEVDAGTMIITQPAERKVLERLQGADNHIPASFIIEQTFDHALERAENALLAELGDRERSEDFLMTGSMMFQGLTEEEFADFVDDLKPQRRTFGKGVLIVQRGDATDVIYVIAHGSTTVRLATSSGSPIRVAALGPGAVFGEMGLIDGSPRSADIVADDETICWTIGVAEMKAYLQRKPEIMAKVLSNLVIELSDRLRQSNRMVMSLR